jgi:hypothetical protein
MYFVFPFRIISPFLSFLFVYLGLYFDWFLNWLIWVGGHQLIGKLEIDNSNKKLYFYLPIPIYSYLVVFIITNKEEVAGVYNKSNTFIFK